MRNLRHWGDLDYWRWRWRRLRSDAGADARVLLGVLLLLAAGVFGYVMAGGVSNEGLAQSPELVRTTVLRPVTTRLGGHVVTTLVSDVETVRLARVATSFSTTTHRVPRTITTPAGTRIVTDSITTSVPVVREVIVRRPGSTESRVETQFRTVTRERSATETQVETETVTRTQTVAAGTETHTDAVTVTHTETTRVPEQPDTETTTVTEPPVTVTVTVPPGHTTTGK
jgi:hypothetical protein